MSNETVQFTEMVRNEYALIQYGEMERQEILLNIREAELNGEITNQTRLDFRTANPAFMQF